MKALGGKTAIKITLFIVLLIFAFFIFSFIVGKEDAIKDNEVGVLVNRVGTFKLYNTGDKPFVFPLFQEFFVISTEPVTLTFIKDEGVKIYMKGEKEVAVESWITYTLDDIEKVIENFGYKEPHLQIRDTMKEVVSHLLKEKILDVKLLDDPKQRISVIAQIHIDLNNIFREKGLSVSSYQMRYR